MYSITEFIQKFILFKEIKEDIICGDQRHYIYEALDQYMNIVLEEINSFELFNTYTNEQLQEIAEDIENYIMRKCYKYVYPAMESEEDNHLFHKCVSLSWLKPQHMEIKEIYVKEKLWQIAINCLHKMDFEKSPVEKLRCVESAFQILINSISFCSGKQISAGVDDIMPILIYVVIKSQPRRMITNLK